MKELSFFGSVLRDDLQPDGNVDVLVVFQPGISRQIEAWIEMEDELKTLFCHEIDLVERSLIVNPSGKITITNSALLLTPPHKTRPPHP